MKLNDVIWFSTVQVQRKYAVVLASRRGQSSSLEEKRSDSCCLHSPLKLQFGNDQSHIADNNHVPRARRFIIVIRTLELEPKKPQMMLSRRRL
jgi:hypothetical protein